MRPRFDLRGGFNHTASVGCGRAFLQAGWAWMGREQSHFHLLKIIEKQDLSL